jgi:nitrile hydratase accessory protein
MRAPDLTALPTIPRDDEGPVFRAPWEAQAFAMAVVLHERGHFTWKEWAARLADEIAAAGARGETDDGKRYYRHTGWRRSRSSWPTSASSSPTSCTRGATPGRRPRGRRHTASRSCCPAAEGRRRRT